MTESSTPLLSICIPTYNRSRFLREALDSIIASASSCLPEVEVVVSDNASPDDTPAVMAEYQARYTWIRYYRNETNIGEANFYHVAQLAKGEYVWIFGDDDKLLPPAIPAVIE
ncbi:partial heptose III glucuronosyltransferase, partial [Anaerolineae bacterium]